jgi:cytochrome c biogenesis protein
MSARTSQRPAKSIVDETLDVLSNVLFPVVVFFVWAIMTTLGTIVDQNKDPQYYYDLYPAGVANLVLRLHLDTVLHSVPYFSLIVLLLISMTVCTFRRVIPKRFPKDRAVPIENFGLHGSVSLAAPSAQTSDAAATFLRSRGFLTRSDDIDGARWLFGDKHKWARYGVLVAHVGFAIISFGVFVGWLTGFKGELQIFDGETATVAEQPGLSLTLRKFTAQFEPVQTPNGVYYQASNFQSDVVVNGGDTPEATSIVVNHPYETPTRVYFYQASYGFGGRIDVRRDGVPVRLAGTGRLMPQDRILLPGTSREIDYMTVLGPSDPSQVPVGVPMPKIDEYALWLVHDNVPTTNRPILLQVGKTTDAGDGYTITALPPIAWTGLTYRRDPGEGWVGAGALVLVAGFVMSLLFVPVKVYARVRGAGSGSVVDIAATTTKGNAIYEAEFNGLLNGLGRLCAQPASGDRNEAETAYA